MIALTRFPVPDSACLQQAASRGRIPTLAGLTRNSFQKYRVFLHRKPVQCSQKLTGHLEKAANGTTPKVGPENTTRP